MTAPKYKHIIFDLDRTLWDFDKNSMLALQEMYAQFELEANGVGGFETFHHHYKMINAGLWDDYRKGLVSRETLSLNRFLNTIRVFKMDDVALAEKMSDFYVKAVSEKTILFPEVHETLTYLQPRYALHVLTNGFADVQYRKLDRSGLRNYFTHIITSEEAGAHKPSPWIFKYALEKIGATAKECLMVGDDPDVDLGGARDAGMDQMLVNFDHMELDHSFTFEIDHLQKIRTLL